MPCEDDESESVYLNVYELLVFDAVNKYLLVPLGLGAYHTGVEVYGEEFSFGYQEGRGSGTFSITPGTAPQCRFRESILIGKTHFSKPQVRRILEELSDEYVGTYDLVNRNCNVFTDALCKILTGNGIPNYINRLSNFASTFRQLLPKTRIGPSIQSKDMIKSSETNKDAQ